MKYEKTPEDRAREENDLKTNPIMRWLQNQDVFSFNDGDILIKKTLVRAWNPQAHSYDKEEWTTEVINKHTKTPKKYVYAFTNKLGIGYIRQLKVDGSGCCSTLICLANFDPDITRFELDPDYVDHKLIGEGDFNWNDQYVARKKHRDEAIAANRKILVKTSSTKGIVEWFANLQPGDEFWWGKTFDDLVTHKYKVNKIRYDLQPPSYQIMPYAEHKVQHALNTKLGGWRTVEVFVISCPADQGYVKPGMLLNVKIFDVMHAKISMQQPFPMKDPLCDPQR